RSANKAFVSASETGRCSSAVDTLLFPLDALAHVGGGARKFAADFGECRAGHFLLTQRRKRLAEAEHGVGRLGVGRVLGRHLQERFRGGIVALALEARLTEPELRVGGEPVARIFGEESLEGVFG